MKDVSEKANSRRLLDALGITEKEESAYRHVLAHTVLTTCELAGLLEQPVEQTRQLLEVLELKGLVTRTTDQPRRYMAASPKVAVDALIRRRQTELGAADHVVQELERTIGKADKVGDGDSLVEVVASRSLSRRIERHLKETAQSEIIGFQCLEEYGEGGARRSNLRMRSISSFEYLKAPGSLDALRTATESGEDARWIAELPIKMFVVDRRVGVVMHTRDLDGSALIVRAGPLLDALCTLFDLIWARATPITFARSGEFDLNRAESRRLMEADKQIVPLLAAGLNDKAIAYQVGISSATLNRRIAALMAAFNARSRFQLGWHVAMKTAENASSPLCPRAIEEAAG